MRPLAEPRFPSSSKERLCYRSVSRDANGHKCSCRNVTNAQLIHQRVPRPACPLAQPTQPAFYSTQSPVISMSNAGEITPELMLALYRRLYPFKSIFNWLNHELSPTKLFTHREFAFTLAGDVYLRYNSFQTADDLKKQVLALNPTRFEIGPVYSARVCSFHRSS